MRRFALLCLVLAPACGADALDSTTLDGPARSVQALNPPLTCTPPASPYTKQQLHQLCNDPEVDELPRPPDPGGFCDVEVRLTKTEFVTGQGATEGRGEISYEASAGLTITPPGDETVASGAEQDYNVGQEVGHSDDLGTYRVPLGGFRDVEICVDFVEHDGNGVNGNNDTASGCVTKRLRCSAADSNGDGLADGQMADSADIGPLNLCGPNVCNGSVSAHIEILASDADMDGVPNDEDVTPEMCDEERKGTAGNAALVYWHYANGGITNLVQSVGLSLAPVFGAYDYVVLVADNESSNPMNANAGMFDNANVTFPPTRQGLLDAIRDLTMQGYRFDTFKFAHGYKSGADDASIEVLDDPTLTDAEEQITGDWLVNATDPCLVGTARGGIPIMAWWSTTCIAERQIDAWITVGALAASGAVDTYFYPTTWGGFLANWVGGDDYRTAVDDSLTWPDVAVSETFIRAEGKLPPYFCTKDDPLTPLPFDGPGVVTDQNDCAFDFFSDEVGNFTAYNLVDVYDETLSGADNMAASSARTFMGNDNLTFGAVGAIWP